MIHQPFPPPGLTAPLPNCQLPHLLILLPILTLLLLTAILTTNTLRSRRQRQDTEHQPSYAPLPADAKQPLPFPLPPPPYPSNNSAALDPPPSCPSSTDTLVPDSYAASYAYTYTDDLPPPLRSTLPIPLSASGRPFTSADLVRSPWWNSRRQYVLGGQRAAAVGESGDGRDGRERVKVTQTRGWVPLGAEEVGDAGMREGEAERFRNVGGDEGQRQVRKGWRRRRMVVFEGLPGDDEHERRVDGQEDLMSSDLVVPRVEEALRSDVDVLREADVWAAMRGGEIEI